MRLAPKGRTSPLWLGQKYDFAINRAKAKIQYTKEDLSKIEDAPEASVLQIRNEKGSYRFVKRNGKWVSATPED